MTHVNLLNEAAAWSACEMKRLLHRICISAFAASFGMRMFRKASAGSAMDAVIAEEESNLSSVFYFSPQRQF